MFKPHYFISESLGSYHLETLLPTRVPIQRRIFTSFLERQRMVEMLNCISSSTKKEGWRERPLNIMTKCFVLSIHVSLTQNVLPVFFKICFISPRLISCNTHFTSRACSLPEQLIHRFKLGTSTAVRAKLLEVFLLCELNVAEMFKVEIYDMTLRHNWFCKLIGANVWHEW